MRTISPLRVFVLLVSIWLAGCYSATGTISHDPVAYLQLQGAREGLTVVVDDLAPVPVVSQKGLARLKVSPGRHRIRVLSLGNVLVDRTILVSDLQTLEISIP